MKKLLLLGLMMASTSVLAKSNANTGVVEARQNIKCRTGGCTLVCKAPMEKAYVRVANIEEAKVVLFGSGTVVFQLELFGEDRQVIIPPGTESCQFNKMKL